MYLYSFENLLKSSQTEKGKEFCNQVKKYYEENYEGKPILALPFSKFKLFHLTGDRTAYQKEYFDRISRLNALQILSITDDKYLEPLEDVISAICSEITWALPAHCLDRNTGNTYNYWEIDLNAAEIGMYLAEIDYVFKDKLSPDIRKRIKYSLEEKIVKPYETRVFGFDTMGNNWASVVSCGVGLTYLYAFPERFNIVKDRIFSAMERYINRLDKDGYCSEGYAYWIYGFGFFALFYDVYVQLTGDRPAILDCEVVKNTIKYAEATILDKGVFIPIADGALSSTASESDAIPVINNLFNSNIKINGGKWDINSYKALSFKRLYFINQDVSSSVKTESSLFFEKSQVLVEKRKNYIFIAKGGTNAEMHNHNDIGAFSIFKNGVQYVVDPGAGEYTNGYFNNMAVRYGKETFVCSALGHSVPIVDGQIQLYGKEYFASVLDKGKDYIVYDLTNAYPKKIKELKVEYSLKENGITAEYSCKGVKERVVFRFISFILPKLSSDEVFIGDMKITNDKNAIATVETAEFSNHQAKKTTVYAIDYAVSGKDINIRFNFDF
ncbi:MAG: heparinase II/III family protein [Clostridia bacterium]|nr:heparinase II/III family protein [Clostridia bacterium]